MIFILKLTFYAFFYVFFGVEILTEVIGAGQMTGPADTWAAIGVSASSRSQYAFITKTDIADQRKAVIRYGLFKSPEKIVRSSQKQSAVLLRIAFIPANGRMRILAGNAVKPLNKRFCPGRKRPEIQRRRQYEKIGFFQQRDDLFPVILLHTGLTIAAGFASKAYVYLFGAEEHFFHAMPSVLRAADKSAGQLLSIAVLPAAANNDQNVLHDTILLFANK